MTALHDGASAPRMVCMKRRLIAASVRVSIPAGEPDENTELLAFHYAAGIGEAVCGEDAGFTDTKIIQRKGHVAEDGGLLTPHQSFNRKLAVMESAVAAAEAEVEPQADARSPSV